MKHETYITAVYFTRSHVAGHTLFIFMLLAGWSSCLFAQQDQPATDTLSLSDFYDMSLQQLDSVKASGVSSELEKVLNSLISVATQKSVSTRTTPGQSR